MRQFFTRLWTGFKQSRTVKFFTGVGAVSLVYLWQVLNDEALPQAIENLLFVIGYEPDRGVITAVLFFLTAIVGILLRFDTSQAIKEG